MSFSLSEMKNYRIIVKNDTVNINTKHHEKTEALKAKSVFYPKFCTFFFEMGK